jgi:hypothetical protein
MAPDNIQDQGKVFVGAIAGYNEDTGRYYVKYHGMSGDAGKGYPAMLISPVPFTDGGGLKAVPTTPVDTPCLLLRASNRYWILGFCTPDGAVINDTHYLTRPIKPGESFQTHGSGTKLGFTDEGSILMWASIWLNAIFNPIKKQFTAFMQNMFINWTAGTVDYQYDQDKKASTLKVQVMKDVDFSPITAGGISPDRVTAKMGVLDNSHILEFDIKQNFDSTNTAQFVANAKLGTQSDGTWLDIESTTNPDTTPVTFGLKVDTGGKVDLNSTNQDDSTSIDISLAPAESDVVTLTINKDKAIVTIDAQGNITLKQTDGANLYLGGKDKAQQLVTKKWLDLVFKNHMHPTAGTGPPSPPIPADSPVASDSLTNITTYTTLAE